MPTGGLSALLSQVCDDAFRNAPVLRNELVNRTKLSTAIASARTRLLDRMLSAEGEPFLGLDGAPPERTIRPEEHTSELQSPMRISSAVFGLKKQTTTHTIRIHLP